MSTIDPSTSDAEVTTSTAPTLAEKRIERISDYLAQSLENSQPEIGLLGGVTADLASVEVRLNQSVAEMLAQCEPSDYLDSGVPESVEIILKVARQIERYLRLQRELARPLAVPVPAAEFAVAPPQSEENAPCYPSQFT